MTRYAQAAFAKRYGSKHLLHAHDPATRAGWRDSVYRVDVFEYLVKKGQWKLKTPLRIKTSQYDTTLR